PRRTRLRLRCLGRTLRTLRQGRSAKHGGNRIDPAGHAPPAQCDLGSVDLRASRGARCVAAAEPVAALLSRHPRRHPAHPARCRDHAGVRQGPARRDERERALDYVRGQGLSCREPLRGRHAPFLNSRRRRVRAKTRRGFARTSAIRTIAWAWWLTATGPRRFRLKPARAASFAGSQALSATVSPPTARLPFRPPLAAIISMSGTIVRGRTAPSSSAPSPTPPPPPPFP